MFLISLFGRIIQDFMNTMYLNGFKHLFKLLINKYEFQRDQLKFFSPVSVFLLKT